MLIHLELIPSGEFIMSEHGLLACTSRPAQGRGVVGHIEQDWIRVISGRCCRDEMERCTVVYDHCNKLEDVD